MHFLWLRYPWNCGSATADPRWTGAAVNSWVRANLWLHWQWRNCAVEPSDRGNEDSCGFLRGISVVLCRRGTQAVPRDEGAKLRVPSGFLNWHSQVLYFNYVRYSLNMLEYGDAVGGLGPGQVQLHCSGGEPSGRSEKEVGDRGWQGWGCGREDEMLVQGWVAWEGH